MTFSPLRPSSPLGNIIFEQATRRRSAAGFLLHGPRFRSPFAGAPVSGHSTKELCYTKHIGADKASIQN